MNFNTAYLYYFSASLCMFSHMVVHECMHVLRFDNAWKSGLYLLITQATRDDLYDTIGLMPQKWDRSEPANFGVRQAMPADDNARCNVISMMLSLNINLDFLNRLSLLFKVKFLQAQRLILQLFRRFTYVTANSPTHPSLHVRHSSLSNPSVASPTSQLILQPFRRFTYVIGTSLTSPGEPPIQHK